MDKVFLFDLDSTVTREEILPTVAKEIGKGDEMRILTESAMMGEVTFEDSFRARVKILQDVPVSKVTDRVSKILLNDKIVEFIRKNKDICYIVTGNLDAWISRLIEKIGLEKNVFCSRAEVVNDKINSIKQVMSKETALTNFDDKVIVAVGDGSNDYEMLKGAQIGIGFGGVRNIAPNLLDVCTYAIYSEDKLCDLLERIRGDDINA